MLLAIYIYIHIYIYIYILVWLKSQLSLRADLCDFQIVNLFQKPVKKLSGDLCLGTLST